MFAEATGITISCSLGGGTDQCCDRLSFFDVYGVGSPV
jgi:hypothetical protein